MIKNDVGDWSYLVKQQYRQAILFFLTAALLSAFVVLLACLSGNFSYLSNVKIVSATGNSAPTLVIDAGHGGEDGGAQANGVLEKDVNLAIARDLEQFLFLTEIETHMTRTEDQLLYHAGEEHRKKYYDLVNRISFAEQFPNAVFISIHQNKFEIPKYKGLQVYFSPNAPESAELAEILQNNAKTLLDPDNKREIKKADRTIRVLNTLKCPAVLVECGFLSNPEEAARLSDGAYQKKTAFILFLSMIEYLQNAENGEC